MTKRENSVKVLWIGVVIAFLLFIVQLFYYIVGGTEQEKTKQVSLIVYGSEPERWENLRQGADLAAADYNAEISIVTMSSEDNYAEQIELIEREIEGGADALLIAACNSDKLGEYFATADIRIPVVFVENGIDSEKYKCLSADNYEMGVLLAKQIIANESTIIKTAIITDRISKISNRDRWQGIYDTLSEYAPNIVIWERKKNETNMVTRKYLQRGLTEEAVDVVVALDNEATVGIIGALENLNKTRRVYAIANSDKAVSFLDRGKINGLGYQNEFSIGYFAVRELFALPQKRGENDSNTIEYEVITKDMMYQDEYQKLIFPFVK